MSSTATIVTLTLLLQLASSVHGQQKMISAESVSHYILSCRKPNGAFGPQDKEYTDVAWTYPAVHALRILDVAFPDDASALANGSQSWIEKNPWKNGPWYWSFYQKANLFKLYGKRNGFEEDVEFGQSWSFTYVPRKSYTEFRTYPRGEFFDMSSLWHLTCGVALLEGKVSNTADLHNYIVRRQSPSGAFVDAVPGSTQIIDENAHIISTRDAVMTLTTLGLPVPQADKCVEWIRSCQTASGGFRWNPDASDHSNKPDVWYTWAAVATLKALGAEPRDKTACIAWINSLQNVDGGFGDRPGWRSRLYSTYYAVHTLHMLTGDARNAISNKMLQASHEALPEGRFGIFQAHHKSPAGGTGMVDSIAAMKLNLVGVKSREMDTISATGIDPSVVRAREYAQQKDYPLEILAAPENYSHKLRWLSGQKADHVSNFLIPPNLSEHEVEVYRRAYKDGQRGLRWEDFREKVIKPLVTLRRGNLFYPELDYTMINAYMVYDDGLDGQPGYNAVPGAHFGNIDWMRHFPYKERWEGVLPVIADGDAHGDMLKWHPNLVQYRNVYIAEHYDFDHYIDASKNQRSVCVIVMPDGEIRYYGAKPAVDYLKTHLKEWRWWEKGD